MTNIIAVPCHAGMMPLQNPSLAINMTKEWVAPLFRSFLSLLTP
ncbi:hypothetical protein [Halobacillus salinus]|nr:hypothetical protein [Halobacillus salinus]